MHGKKSSLIGSETDALLSLIGKHCKNCKFENIGDFQIAANHLMRGIFIGIRFYFYNKNFV